MGNFLSKNIRFLRTKAGLSQSDFTSIGIKKATLSNYENGNTEPKIDVLMQLSKFLGCEVGDLLSKDLSVLPVKQETKTASIDIVAEPTVEYKGELLTRIPIIDAEAAAGIQGVCNPDYIEVLGYLTLPTNSLQKRTGVYYAIRNRGHSMSPTIYDKDYLIVRWLDRGEWQELRDEYIYVIVADGNTYVKRIKDRLKRGFMVCMSDNLDKANYPNFTLDAEEIDNLFYTELKISPHLPNVNATYYDRVKSLEDKVDELAAWRRSLSK